MRWEWHMVLPLLRLHDVRGEWKALRRESDAVPEAEIKRIID